MDQCRPGATLQGGRFHTRSMASLLLCRMTLDSSIGGLGVLLKRPDAPFQRFKRVIDSEISGIDNG
ncbi:MAG: hypothetical protein LBK73_15695 [Treponema sp.]|nr:hypothetical protein [Treponema sp.]